MRSWRVQRGAAGQVETQAAGRSSCSAVSSCPVVPSGRSVLGCVFSAAVLGAKNVCFGAKSYVLEPNRTFWNHNVLCTNSVAIGDLFRLQCVQMCTDVPSGSDISPSAVKAALQASGRRGSIVGVQISFRDGKLPPWQMPRALDAERHAISQELPSHSRLPVCRPCDSALACRQYRLLCAWSASFGKLSPWQ